MSTSSSPAPFDFSSTHASSVPPTSTAASSPPPDELDEDADAEPDAELEARYKRLSFVLEKSAMYSTVLKAQMDSAKERHRAAMRERAAAPRPAKRARRTSKTIEDEQGDADDDGDGDGAAFPQPALVTGARLKDYQLEGLQWMVSLHENGISGILADEMGLGKTLQTIAFSAHLRELGFGKPFLVVCPLSVLHNWVEEYRRFAPEIPVVMYHGTPAERAELRRTVLRWPPAPSSSTKSKSTKRKHGAEAAPAPTFPIVLTTYELAIRDRPVLAALPWGYIVVDEGHRLKNFGCRLMQELKRYGEGGNAGRMVLTGTPLHNNLAELWSLLHFILPDIFDDVDAFQEWFNLRRCRRCSRPHAWGHSHSAMHAILKPFLLRRLKSDVLTG
ncbi:P-loop containing nucleoside triphosphate hydrolase protein, partial [Mycena sp. CBHHK59/15]